MYGGSLYDLAAEEGLETRILGELDEANKKKIEKLWGDKKRCAEYSANCKDISFDTIDEYYEKIMKVYQ